MIVLDTHVLVWADTDVRKLGRKTRMLIDKFWNAGKVGVSALSFWEVGLLQHRKRLRLSTSTADWRESVLTAGVREFALDGVTAMRALDLTTLHDDPADRFIAATALVQGAVLVTADERLLDWNHPLERADATR